MNVDQKTCSIQIKYKAPGLRAFQTHCKNTYYVFMDAVEVFFQFDRAGHFIPLLEYVLLFDIVGFFFY